MELKIFKFVDSESGMEGALEAIKEYADVNGLFVTALGVVHENGCKCLLVSFLEVSALTPGQS